MSDKIHLIYLLLGSNQGDKAEHIRKAVSYIGMQCGKIVTTSELFFSESWGYDDEFYANKAVCLQTNLSPSELLLHTQKIEKLLGRTKKTSIRYEARAIDIDILLYDNLMISNEKLTIPHPRMHLRNFVLQPLAEIAPSMIHPVLKKTISKLAKECPDKGKVWQ